MRYLGPMTVSSTLFRLLVATILMLNGIASAMAAVQHAAGPGEPGPVAETPTMAGTIDPAGGDAHGDCTDSGPELADDAAATTASSHGAGHHPGPDCCDPGTCQCACANAGLPALPPEAREGFAAPGRTCAPATAAMHAAPALPHLIRPPIS
jgi:hypothetical protein